MIPGSFGINEWVMKPALAVLWARKTYPNLANVPVTLGGHSGGGPACMGAGYYLATKANIQPAAYALQHPGAVAHLNVPGCAASAHKSSGKYYCEKYFPENVRCAMRPSPSPAAHVGMVTLTRTLG